MICVSDLLPGDTCEGHTVAAVRREDDQIVVTDETGKERRYWAWQQVHATKERIKP